MLFCFNNFWGYFADLDSQIERLLIDSFFYHDWIGLEFFWELHHVHFVEIQASVKDFIHNSSFPWIN